MGIREKLPRPEAFFPLAVVAAVVILAVYLEKWWVLGTLLVLFILIGAFILWLVLAEARHRDGPETAIAAIPPVDPEAIHDTWKQLDRIVPSQSSPKYEVDAPADELDLLTDNMIEELAWGQTYDDLFYCDFTKRLEIISRGALQLSAVHASNDKSSLPNNIDWDSSSTSANLLDMQLLLALNQITKPEGHFYFHIEDDRLRIVFLSPQQVSALESRGWEFLGKPSNP